MTILYIYLIFIAIALYVWLGEMICRDILRSYKLSAIQILLLSTLWVIAIPAAILAMSISNIYYEMKHADNKQGKKDNYIKA